MKHGSCSRTDTLCEISKTDSDAKSRKVVAGAQGRGDGASLADDQFQWHKLTSAQQSCTVRLHSVRG